VVSGQCRPQQYAIVSHSFPSQPTVWDDESLFHLRIPCFSLTPASQNSQPGEADEKEDTITVASP
jgi:hypothetical protein